MALDDYFDVTDARVTPSDVIGGGFGTELTTDQIEQNIIKAHHRVESVLVGFGVDDETLALIELDLTRHCITFGAERQVDKDGSGPSSRTYSGTFGRGLDGTTYGQLAMDRDPSNRLGKDLMSFSTVGGKDGDYPSQWDV